MARRGPHPAAVARTTPEARRGRTPPERLAVRWPGLARVLARAILGLRRSQPRTWLVTYAVRRGYAAFNRRDWELNTVLHHPTDCRWDAANLQYAPPDARDLRGIDEYVEGMNRWVDGWEDLRIVVEDVFEVGQDQVLGILRQIGTGTSSGITVDVRLSDRITFRDGWVIDQALDRPEVALRELALEDRQ